MLKRKYMSIRPNYIVLSKGNKKVTVSQFKDVTVATSIVDCLSVKSFTFTKCDETYIKEQAEKMFAALTAETTKPEFVEFKSLDIGKTFRFKQGGDLFIKLYVGCRNVITHRKNKIKNAKVIIA